MIPVVNEIALVVVGSPAMSLIVKATVVSAAALAVTRLARRRRASVRHLVLATTFVVLAALPLVPVVVPARQLAVPILEPAQDTAATSPVVLAAPAVDPLAAHADPADAKSTPRTRPAPSTVLLAAWSAGAVLVLVPMIAGLLRVRRVRRNGLPWRDGQKLVAGIASAMGVRRPIQVLLDDAADGPMTCGGLRPAIILPRDARHWTTEDLRRAIVHEIEHVRRADWLTLCLARSVCTVYWFNPFHHAESN